MTFSKVTKAATGSTEHTGLLQKSHYKLHIIRKMLRNFCMGIKTIYHIKIFCIFRRLFW